MKTNRLITFLLLILFFGCSKDELTKSEFQNQKKMEMELENKPKDIFINEFKNPKKGAIPDIDNIESKVLPVIGGGGLSGIGINTPNTINVYVDYNALTEDINNALAQANGATVNNFSFNEDGFNGLTQADIDAFIVTYEAEMTLHYTIYNIQASTSCHNVHMWEVDAQEYQNYHPEIDLNPCIGSATTGIQVIQTPAQPPSDTQPKPQRILCGIIDNQLVSCF